MIDASSQFIELLTVTAEPFLKLSEFQGLHVAIVLMPAECRCFSITLPTPGTRPIGRTRRKSIRSKSARGSFSPRELPLAILSSSQ
jgi:hypothetical protein